MRYCFLRFPEGKPKAVTFSYDDGCRQDLHLAEIANRYGIKCTFNINSSFLGKKPGKGPLTAEEIAQYLLPAGHEIAVHGAEHRAPGSVRPIEGIQDVLNCRIALEKIFGHIIRGMAYPDTGIGHLENGNTYENIRRYLMDLDIAYARTLGRDNDRFELPPDWYQWRPTAHHNNPRVTEYVDKFVALDLSKEHIATTSPKLFYLWGHSYEFDNDNNWDHLEAIWLVFSADSTLVYNPTLYVLWLEIDGTLCSIQPGETLHL